MRKLCLLLSLTSLVACATPYQEMGFTGGVSSVRLGADLVEVRAKGNGLTSKARVRDFVLLRAANDTLNAGFTHFAILTESDTTTTKQTTLSKRTYTDSNTQVSGTMRNGRLDANANTQSTSTTYGGNTITSVRPGQTVLVQMLPSSDYQGLIYDAQLILNELSPKYVKQAE